MQMFVPEYTVASHCASSEDFNSTNHKCDSVINCSFQYRAEPIKLFYHLCTTREPKWVLAMTFCEAPWVLLRESLLRLLTQCCGMKIPLRQTVCIIAFVRSPFWSLKGSNVILMIVPLSNIAFTFLPFYAQSCKYSWVVEKIRCRALRAVCDHFDASPANDSLPFTLYQWSLFQIIKAPLAWTFVWHTSSIVHSHPLTRTCSIENPSFTFCRNNSQQIASQ